MPVHRLKHSFTSGVISPIMYGRVDNDRYKNGCHSLQNMYAKVQGPCIRRPGSEMIYDLTLLDAIMARIEPFIFKRDLTYNVIFYETTGGEKRIAFGHKDGIIEDSSSPGEVYFIEISGIVDIPALSLTQSGNWMYMAQHGRQLLGLHRIEHQEWEVVEIAPSADTPSSGEWNPDWSDEDGWPTRIGFFEERMVYASTELMPQHVYLSKSGDFFNTVAGTEVSDPFSIAISSGQKNEIQWMASASQLMLGTLGDEWSLDGTGNEPISFSSISSRRRTSIGGEPLAPIMVGPATIFVEQIARRVMQLIYDYNIENYSAVDLSMLAPHLTETETIVDWAYQQVPNSIIWAVRSDGALLGLTYQRDNKVVGWHEHYTQGKVKSISCIPGERETSLYMVVEREIEGVPRLYYERLSHEFIGSNTMTAFFLDSFKYQTYETEVTIVEGLEHLEGLEVDILSMGAVHPPRTVVGGQIELQSPTTNVTVGLKYISECRPNVAELSDDSGTNVGRMQTVTNIDALIYNSLGMWIGREDTEDGDHVEEVPFRVPGDLTGQAVPLFTGIKRISFPEGYDRSVGIIIQQRDPLPLTILSITDTVKVNY